MVTTRKKKYKYVLHWIMYMPAEGLIDMEEERNRLESEIKRLESEVARGEKMLEDTKTRLARI